MTLTEFLAQKPLYYDKIDLKRFPKAYALVQHRLPQNKIIHLVGTNGKGSTGRFLATALHRSGKQVGHYTSPHILRFNERIWINGADTDDETLEAAHLKLLALLSGTVADELSYFEYTTLLAMIVYETCDYVVCEAGLGGEFDATAVFPKELSIFTPIDFDHAAFLGNSIDSIASTKLRSMQHVALIGKQKHPEVEQIAQKIAHEKGCTLYKVLECMTLDIETMALHLAMKNNLSEYLRDNLILAMAAYECLGYTASEELFDQHALFGRLTRIASNITLDVGHNPLAAREIARAYEGKKVVLIYNTYGDKEYRDILKILHPIIASVEIIDVDESRIVPRDELERALSELQIEYRSLDAIDNNQEYLVFGSFSVAETFLKRMNVTSTMV